MVVMHKKTIRAYGAANPRAKEALDLWYAQVVEVSWATPTDVRNTMGYADQIGDERFVFNIKGNHYRLIVKIHYNSGRMFIRFVGTHAEYSKINAEEI